MSTITPNTQPAQGALIQPDILAFDQYSDSMIERVTSSVVQEKEPQTDGVVGDSSIDMGADKPVVVVDIPEKFPPTRFKRLGEPIVGLAMRLKNRRNLNQEAGLTIRVSTAMLIGAVTAGENIAYVGKHRSEKNRRKLVLAGIGAVALAGLAYVAYRNWDGGINDLLRNHTPQKGSKSSGAGIGPRSPLFPRGTGIRQIPPSTPKGRLPGAGSAQPYWMNIQPGDGIESEIQDWARNMGYSGFNARQTHQVFLEAQKQFGNNLISIPSHPGPDTYTVGMDVRISAPGRGRFASLPIQSFVNSAIKSIARTS